MRNFIDIVEGQRLDELVGYKGTDEFKAFQDYVGRHDSKMGATANRDMLGQFVRFLESKGFNRLGQGSFGAVFDHPKLDYAIKIFRNDAAYMEFINYVQDNKDNPYLPRFRGRFMKLDTQNYVVRMEKLDPLDYDSPVSEVAEYVESMGAENWIEKCLESRKREEMDSSEETLVTFSLNHTGFCHTINDIINMTKHGTDFHARNFMMRGDTPVITDPTFDPDSM